jgi:aspartyl-tRNA(Asn)/glutamyl-tRNA(Gln) amidotransferase subunit A
MAVQALRLGAAVRLGVPLPAVAAYACGADLRKTNSLVECVDPLDGETGCGFAAPPSGSAVYTVAREACFASLGTDTAGSIRMPAASCRLLDKDHPKRTFIHRRRRAACASVGATVGIVARSCT